MAAAIAVTPAQDYTSTSVAVTGATPATNYTLQIVFADGSTRNVAFTTDGSGNFTYTYPGVDEGFGNDTFTVLTTPSTLVTTAAPD